MRSETAVELNDPPHFDYGQKVRSKKVIRNDGTFPGREIGEAIVQKGDVGYVASIGTFLQQFYIYGIYFPERGYAVGCRSKELELVDGEAEEDGAVHHLVSSFRPSLRSGREPESSECLPFCKATGFPPPRE